MSEYQACGARHHTTYGMAGVRHARSHPAPSPETPVVAVCTLAKGHEGCHYDPALRGEWSDKPAADSRDSDGQRARDVNCVAQWFEDSWTGSTDEPVYQAVMRLRASVPEGTKWID